MTDLSRFVTDAAVAAMRVARNAYWDDPSLVERCLRCDGSGQKHGDFCNICSGNGEYHIGTEEGADCAALLAALAVVGPAVEGEALERAAQIADQWASQNSVAAAKATRRAARLRDLGDSFGHAESNEVMAAELTGAEHETRAIAAAIRALAEKGE